MLTRSRLILLASFALLIAVGFQCRERWRKVPRLRLAPLERQEAGDEVLRFLVIGDSGSGGAAQQRVAQAMEERCRQHLSRAILLLGDNFYQRGVESVNDAQWQSKLLEPYSSPCLAQLPFYPVLGNHDYKGNPTAQIEYTLLNPRWYFPNRFYSIRFGDLVRVVAYDSQMSDWCMRPQFCGVDYLLDRVAQKDVTWTIAMGHHPLRSASTKSDGGQAGGGPRDWLLTPRLCQNTDLYLSGHAHHLEERQVPGCKMHLVVSGGAGADLYPIKTDPESLFARSIHGFAEIELSKRELVVRFFGDDGAMVYERRQQR